MHSAASIRAVRLQLAIQALELGAARVPNWSKSELMLVAQAQKSARPFQHEIEFEAPPRYDRIGASFSQRVPAEVRRELGATYTPEGIVNAMVEWAASVGQPERIVDPGCGSGRFLVAAGKRFPKARLIGVDVDPLASIMTRGNLAAAGLASRADVRLADYRALDIGSVAGRTLYIGNPPYVRHHRISKQWKDWLVASAKRLNLHASQLAGLHAYFFVATALLAKERDWGAFITASEWLDVNYGQLIRDLVVGKLGGQSLLVIEPTAMPFPDTATTATITAFEVGKTRTSVRLRSVSSAKDVGLIGTGAQVSRQRLASEKRWTHLLRTRRELPSGYVELGELCRVHRGQVTGANRVWIESEDSACLPDSVLFPSVTRAKELFNAGTALVDAEPLRRVIDIPSDLDSLTADEKRAVKRFLKWARTLGADRSYVAMHRKAWWAVGLRDAPPIMATYMARRPPAFVENRAAARYINIAHGLYPREHLTTLQLRALVAHLRSASVFARGRTYAGGLMKFEPREMERLPVPDLAELTEIAP
jgi:adenine-specific DNA-methyltransferase